MESWWFFARNLVELVNVEEEEGGKDFDSTVNALESCRAGAGDYESRVVLH